MYTDISPILNELYPNVDKMQDFVVSQEVRKVNALLISMQKNNLIEYGQYSIGGGNTTNGFDWIDTVQIMSAITQAGKDALDSEIAKGETSRLIESTILTNESIRESNTVTVQNLIFQKKTQKWTVVLAGLSTLFILITVIQAHFDDTSEELKGIREIMMIQSHNIQNLDSSLKQIKSSIEVKMIDTFLHKR